MPAVLRATNEAGETYDDPSEDLLFELLDELGPGNSFLIVERLEPERAGHFMQTVIGPNGKPYVLEYREGPKETHRSTPLESMWAVHEVLTKWAFDLPVGGVVSRGSQFTISHRSGVIRERWRSAAPSGPSLERALEVVTDAESKPLLGVIHPWIVPLAIMPLNGLRHARRCNGRIDCVGRLRDIPQRDIPGGAPMMCHPRRETV